MVTLFSMTIGELVKQALKKRGLSQIELSQRANVSPAQISRIVNDERGASLDTLLLIADTLGIRRDHILRAAAGLPDLQENSDAWVEEMNHKIKLVPAGARSIAEKMLDALIEEPQPQAKPKKARAA